ncbi:MAG: potassium channel family protein [Caulobacter sp.]|nr:potassium channel family protein [Caulobacter sp.]
MNPGTLSLLQNLGLATAMVAATVMIHFWGLIVLLRLMGHTGRRLRAHDNAMGQAALLVIVVFGLIGLHTIEIWLYAIVYLKLAALPSLEAAVYFSTVTFVALGYGDIVLGQAWRLVSAIEAANGVILIAWSTAFLVAVTARLRALEHDWLKPQD